MEKHVRLDRLDQYLENVPEYISAVENIRKTAESLGIQEEQLEGILKACRQVEQIRADYLFHTGIPVKEKHCEYNSGILKD